MARWTPRYEEIAEAIATSEKDPHRFQPFFLRLFNIRHQFMTPSLIIRPELKKLVNIKSYQRFVFRIETSDVQEPMMSTRTGDRAKFNREHKKRMQRRLRGQELRETLEGKAPTSLPKPVQEREMEKKVTSRLRQLTGGISDPASWEIVISNPSRRTD